MYYLNDEELNNIVGGFALFDWINKIYTSIKIRVLVKKLFID